MPEQNHIDTIVCGQIHRETIINQLDQVSVDHPGGGVLYAAAGHALLNENVGIVAKANSEFLAKFSPSLERYGFDISGMTPSTQPLQMMKYYHILSQDKWETTNMKRHFYELGYSVPKFLLHYDELSRRSHQAVDPQDIHLLIADIPERYLPARAALLTQLNFESHFACVPALKTAGVGLIMMRSSPTYMCPGNLSQITKLLNGVDYFFTTEQEIKTLFQSRFDHYWMMLETLNRFGAKNIVVKNSDKGYILLHQGNTQISQIPEYDGLYIDPIGDYDCFCGTFTACMLLGNYSSPECAVYASAAASMCREGSGIAYILDSHRSILKLRAELMMTELCSTTLTALSHTPNDRRGL